MAKSWFPSLRGGVETKGLAERVRSSSTNYTVTGTPYSQNWNTGRAVREGFQANPWVFRACEVVAQAGIQRKIVMRDGDPDHGDLIPMRNDPSRALYCLNRRANPWETSKMLRYRLYVLWLLSSKGLHLEIARSRAGRIANIFMLDPDLVDVIPSRDNPISAFEIRTTGDTGGRRDPLPPFNPEIDPSDEPNQVLWIRSPHPTVLTAGMSAMEAAGLSVDLDRYARLYNRNYMQSGGRPGGILGIRGQVNPTDVIKLENEFNRDARPGRTTAIQADAMFYQDLSTAPRDMQWGEVMDRMRKEASMVFGVPESMMGDASGKTFDNADAEYAIFMEHRFAGLIDMIDDQIDILSGADQDDAYIRHDMTDVWVLGRHQRAEEDRWAADLERGAITYNDYRDHRGLPPIDAPWAKVCWIPPQRMAGYVTDPTDASAAAGAPMGGMPAQPDQGAAGGPPGMDLGGAGGDPTAAFGSPGLDALNAAAAGGGGGGPASGGANLRLLTADGQGRSSGGGMGAIEGAALNARRAIEAAPPPDVEGKQSRARPDRAPTGPTWR